jgi:hypothetical protein
MIDRLELKWSTTGMLWGEPIRITIHKVSLVFLPQDHAGTSTQPARRRASALVRKRLQLKRYEQAKEQARHPESSAAGKDEDSAGIYERLTSQLLSNLIVQVKQVHIRYEDQVSSTWKPFSFGMALDSIQVYSKDSGAHWGGAFAIRPHKSSESSGIASDSGTPASNGEERQPSSTHDKNPSASSVSADGAEVELQAELDEKGLIYKQVELRGLSVYWDPHVRDANFDYMHHHYLLRPLDADVRLRFCSDPDAQVRGIPATTVDARVRSFELVAEDSQLQDACRLSAFVAKSAQRSRYSSLAQAFFERTQEGIVNEGTTVPYLKAGVGQHENLSNGLHRDVFEARHLQHDGATISAHRNPRSLIATGRPVEPVKSCPRVWWRYAIAAVSQESYEKTHRQTLAYLDKRRRQRLAYVEAWQRKKVGVDGVPHVPRQTRERLVRANAEKKARAEAEEAAKSVGNVDEEILEAHVEVEGTVSDSTPQRTHLLDRKRKKERKTRKLQPHLKEKSQQDEPSPPWRCKVCWQMNAAPDSRHRDSNVRRDENNVRHLSHCKTCGRAKGLVPSVYSLWENAVNSEMVEVAGQKLSPSKDQHVMWLPADEQLAALSPIDMKLLEELEARLSYEDIVFFRVIAERELRWYEEIIARREGAKARRRDGRSSAKNVRRSSQNFGGWGDYLWNSLAGDEFGSNQELHQSVDENHSGSNAESDLSLTEADMQKFFKDLTDSVAYDPTHVLQQGQQTS